MSISIIKVHLATFLQILLSDSSANSRSLEVESYSSMFDTQ